MALSLVGGAAIGALFGALYDVVKISIGKTAMQYKPLLSDLKFTLDSLRPRIIQQIGDQNMELGISNEDIESLQRQMEEGTELVRMLSNRGTWSCYILCSCCNCNKPSYAEQLVELDRSLRILLEILKLQEARDVKEVLLLARKINDKQGELERRLADLLKVQQESGDGGESSGSSAETTPHEQNGENGGQQVAPSGGGVGPAALGAAFGVLFDTVMQVKDKTTMLKRPLGDLKSTLDSVKPLIEEVAECSKVLNLPKEELEDVRIQMEKGAELVSNCSKVRQWTSYKTYEYTNKLLGLDESLQRLLTVLRVQLARDVRESLVSVSNIEVVINQIEGSGVVKLQNEQNEAKGSCEEPTAMAKSAVGLNTLSVEGTRDVSETLDPEANIKVGWQKVKESWVAQSKTEHPSRTVGLDAMDMQVGARSMEETSVSDVEAGLQQIQGKEVYELDVPFRELEEDVLKDEEDEELDEQVEDHHDRKKGAESVTGASGDGMASCKADGCAVDLSDAKAYYRRHRVCELHSKAPLVVVSGLKRRFCYKCSRFHDLSEFDDTKQSCRRHLPYIEQDGTGTQLKDVSGDIDTVISRTEWSGVVQSQNDRSDIKDSYEVVEATPPAVGLNVPSVQRTRDSREILQTSVSNIEAGLKQILGKDVFDFEAPYAEYKETEFIPSSVTVDLGVLLRRLKRFFLNDEVSAVVLTGPAGSGKTTLAKFFCEDEEVKNIFKNNIFFVHVSENPSLSLMVQTLYQQMGFQMPVLQDESIALHSLHEFFMETALHPSVLVLDDVWPGSESLLDKFDEFKTSNYKIMVTSRYEFPAFSFPYYLKPLNAEDEIESLDDEDLICVSPPHSVTFDDKGLITHFPDSSASYLGDGSSHVATAIRPMDQFHDSCASILGDKNSYVPKDAGTMFPLDNPVKSTQTHMQRELELKKDSGEKLMKFAGSRNECGSLKAEVEESSAAGDNKPAEESTKPSESPKKDYIHVRARRGQATDSHSLAERVRREKISERMKILQDLVPGCNKVIGKARLLDEIINYIQSMQHQVEFLSMKLEAVNSRMNMNPTIEAFPPKDKDSGEKLMKFAGSRNESGSLKAEVEESSAAGDKQPAEESTKPSESPKQDYIHVKARRGQATDSQSLAERVRREQISERMKILQDLVPGCNKVVGKALLLDEIINYIQSLQHQVEFLSIKLAAVNPRMNMNPTIEAFPAEDLVAQPFDDAGLSFGSHKPREYDQSSQPEGLHMHVVGSFEKQRKFRG